MHFDKKTPSELNFPFVEITKTKFSLKNPLPKLSFSQTLI